MVLDFWGLATFLVALLGAFYTYKHYVFFSSSNHPLSLSLRLVFLSDLAGYFLVAVFGLLVFFGAPHSWFNYPDKVRVLIMLSNIWALVRLYKHYYDIGHTKHKG